MPISEIPPIIENEIKVKKKKKKFKIQEGKKKRKKKVIKPINKLKFENSMG